jgi:hypothetical protein
MCCKHGKEDELSEFLTRELERKRRPVGRPRIRWELSD